MNTDDYPSILTTIHVGRNIKGWDDRTTLFADNRPGLNGLLKSAIRLFRLRKDFDVTIVHSIKRDNLFALLAGLLRGPCPPIIMTDCLWYKHRRKHILWLKRLQMHIMARAVTYFVVWASHEVEDYAYTFMLSKDKFLYVPYHHTLEGYEFEVSQGDYIFSGGDGDRDYPTLLEAVRGLDIPVIIATRRKDILGGKNLPRNVNAFPVTNSDFRKWMAGSKMVVVPMKKGLLHSGGQQTYLNAMAMGKPVIVADDCGAKDYIQHGVDGLIVPAGNSQGLREAIQSLISDSALSATLSTNGKSAFHNFSTVACYNKLSRIAGELAELHLVNNI